MEKVLIAIDQGNSKTELITTSTNGNILARRYIKYPLSVNIEVFEEKRWEYIERLFLETISSINKSISDIAYLLAAVCGADSEDDIEKIRQSISNILGVSKDIIVIVSDSEAALRSAIPAMHQPSNYAVIYAGTMFNCSLLSSEGNLFTYGRSVNICDNGSYAIGQRVWKTIIDAYNGFSRETLLVNLFLQYHRCDSMTELIADFSNGKRVFTPTDYTSILFDAVRYKDKTAIEIMEHFARRWSLYIINGLSKIGISNDAPINIALSGGLFRNYGGLWVQLISANLSKECKSATISSVNTYPIIGAILLVLEKYNVKPLAIEIIHNVLNSYFVYYDNDLLQQKYRRNPKSLQRVGIIEE